MLEGWDDPQRAFENWMDRDQCYAQQVLRQAAEYKYKTILVDGKQNTDGQFKQIRDYFGLL